MSGKKSGTALMLSMVLGFFIVIALNHAAWAAPNKDFSESIVSAETVDGQMAGFFKSMVSFFQSVFVPQAAVIAQGEAENSSGYVGAETCQTCHQDKYDSYIQTAMGNKLNPGTPAAQHECESCHGPGAAHVEAGGGRGVGGIINPGPKSPLSVKEKNAVCLDCHSTGKRALWQGSMHQSKGLACSNCHSVHGGNPGNFVKETQAETCSQCHKQIKAAIQKQSHHPIKEGKINCSDCHNPHGTVTEKLLTANSVNEKCYECHTEKRGPFLWEHPPATENCLTCHTPHGASQNKLLVSKPPYLCQSCHSNSRHPGSLYGLNTTNEGTSEYVVLSSRIYYRACLNCHAQFHGSNHPSGKSFLR